MFLSNCVLKTIPWVIGCTIYNVISTTVKNAIVVFAEESSTLPGWRSAKWRGKSMSFPITYDFWCNNVLLLPATNGFYFIGSELVVSTWKRFLLVIPYPLSEKHLLKSRCRFHSLHLHLDVWLFNIDRN